MQRNVNYASLCASAVSDKMAVVVDAALGDFLAKGSNSDSLFCDRFFSIVCSLV